MGLMTMRFMTAATFLVMATACTPGNDTETSTQERADVAEEDYIAEGKYVVCTDGSATYYGDGVTGDPCVGREETIDYIIYNVPSPVGDEKAPGGEGSSDDFGQATEEALSNRGNFDGFLAAGLRCECANGTVTVCNSDVNTPADCEGICDEAAEALKNIQGRDKVDASK